MAGRIDSDAAPPGMHGDHAHDHDHAHAHHHDHAHRPRGPRAERRLLWAMALTGGFMIVEFAGGLLAGSLALIADAGHMLTDVAALVLAYAGIRLGRRAADAKRSYGYRRLEVLAAFVNGLALLALTVWIAVEAVQRIAAPVPILGGPMLAVAVLGLLVNLAAFAILRHGHDHDLNLGAALVHVLGDLLGSIAAIVAALVVRATGWTPIDPILALVVAGLIVRSGVAIVRASAHILLEGTPPGIDLAALARELAGIDGVAAAGHVHVWSLTAGETMATLHLRLAPGAAAHAVLPAVKRRLRERYGIAHSTIEIDLDPDAPDAAAANCHGLGEAPRR